MSVVLAGERFSCDQDRRIEQLIANADSSARVIEIDLSSCKDLAMNEVAYLLRRAFKLLIRGQSKKRRVAIIGLGLGDRQRICDGLAYRNDLELTQVDARGRMMIKLRHRLLVEVEGRKKPLRIGRGRRKIALVIERDGDRCVWCGRQLSYCDPQASLDHLLPDSEGGSANLANLVLACCSCNVHRGTTPAERYLRDCRERGQAVAAELIVRRLAERHDQLLPVRASG